ncbi:hypothetical protein LTR78_002313 [Recurvomyces mirabilis]|uniref:Uncharacterized protein n=1 Tax=Recurvomyces mirabilis TaxID=574656 RepID=A0AAE0WUS5_9PEZI|nr:hypothetical protein LTR78_002313 [Recurvomyces mirabilis]KAK5160768.1 hypothetical protein LTS14_001781 [Recurvomyces mirabilis]
MVLEEAAASSDSFQYNNDSFPSDPDRYESMGSTDSTRGSGEWMRIPQKGIQDANQETPVYINLNNLPRRFALINAGDHPDFVIKGIQQQCFFVAQTLQRPITQPEADALAYHFAKSLRMASYGSPIGTAIAVALAYRGRKTYRFPGWTPFKEGSRFSKDRFGPLFTGYRARIAWQGTRFWAYGMVGAVLGQIFFGSYALSVSLAGRAMDPRLKSFNEALREKQKSGLGAQVGRRAEDESAGPRGMETYDMARQRRSAQGTGINRKGREQKEEKNWDDASPTGSMSFDEEVAYGAEQSGFMSEQEVQRQADARMSTSSDRSSPQETGRPTNNPRTSQSSRASRENTESKQPSSGSGGAWDRLRQEAMSSSSSQRSPSTSSRGMTPSNSAGARAPGRGREDASSGDSFSFSSDDADRQLAKGEAQREFDARLERERTGGDFVAGGGGGRRKWT